MMFVTKSAAIKQPGVQNVRQVNITEITAWFIFPERHLNPFPSTVVFQNTAKFSCMYSCMYSPDIFYVSWKYSDLISGESWLARK